MQKFHNFGNSVVRFAINNLFESEIKDKMTGYRAFSYNFVKTYPVISKGFELYPFVWYSVIRNHSAVHLWMTHRNLAVTIFAISVMITYSLVRDSSVKLTLKRKSENTSGVGCR